MMATPPSPISSVPTTQQDSKPTNAQQPLAPTRKDCRPVKQKEEVKNKLAQQAVSRQRKHRLEQKPAGEIITLNDSGPQGQQQQQDRNHLDKHDTYFAEPNGLAY